MDHFRPDTKDVIYVGAGASINGSLHAQQTIVVDGVVDGEIACAHLVVGELGVVDGGIAATAADVAGTIGPRIAVDRLLSVRASGRVEGQIAYTEIEIDKGGVVKGEASPSNPEPAARERSPERRPEKHVAAKASARGMSAKKVQESSDAKS